MARDRSKGRKTHTHVPGVRCSRCKPLSKAELAAAGYTETKPGTPAMDEKAIRHAGIANKPAGKRLKLPVQDGDVTITAAGTEMGLTSEDVREALREIEAAGGPGVFGG